MNFIFQRYSKVRFAKDHGRKFRSELAPSFSSIIHWLDEIRGSNYLCLLSNQGKTKICLLNVTGKSGNFLIATP